MGTESPAGCRLDTLLPLGQEGVTPPFLEQMDFPPCLVFWLRSERFLGPWKGAKSCLRVTLTSRQAGNGLRWEKGRRGAINSNLPGDKGN